MAQFTDKQKREIIGLIDKGMSNWDIARKFGVSPQSVAAVKAHMTMGTYAKPLGADALPNRTDPELPESEEQIDAALDATFGLERDLQQALRSNIGQLEEGLSVVDGGREIPIDVGRIDIKAEDKQGNVVIIELKAGTALPDSVTQTLAYMGSVAETEHRPVRGILVAGDFHPRVIFAARAVPNLQLRKYTFNFSCESVE